MSKQTEMHYGELDQVTYWLGQGSCSKSELEAALINAFRHIEHLTKRINQLETKGAAPTQEPKA